MVPLTMAARRKHAQAKPAWSGPLHHWPKIQMQLSKAWKDWVMTTIAGTRNKNKDIQFGVSQTMMAVGSTAIQCRMDRHAPLQQTLGMILPMPEALSQCHCLTRTV